ncbi:DNA-3-methyladenine glycosylase 2 [Tumebacillus permanentifrigoris]|uniref:DNA-3-methyladenine glycosylase II n=1 Tax=Tumebacillus permanentifrigoris TaxID=378543 RepID=A0A316D6Q8_9BACL|nr:DNA-3-methyladenine glycosylase [Tumebacillus permanentifrigoris]PWK11215.1 DNA-3-methyladenine glycosylase II [Tumebacillus permanentifrigoris]
MSEPTPHCIRFQTPAEFHYDEILCYLSRSLEELLYTVEDSKVYRLLCLQGSYLAIRIESPTPDSLEVHIEGSDTPPTESQLQEAARYVWDWFDLGRDLRPFYQMAAQDPVLHRVVSQHYGLRVVGEPHLFEAICWAIIGQQISLKIAYAMKRRLVETFGQAVTYNGRTYWTFPTPAVVAKLTVDDLFPLKFTQKKCEYLIDIAKRVCSGTLTKQKLLEMNNLSSVVKELTAIRGIGNWTANYVVMRCLRYPDAFPIEDVALQNAVKQQLGLDRKPTLDELRERALSWRGWEAYATFYLWRSLQGA